MTGYHRAHRRRVKVKTAPARPRENVGRRAADLGISVYCRDRDRMEARAYEASSR